MIRVTCEACGKGFSAKDEHAGRRGKCPSCGAPIVVPSASGEAPAGAAPDSARGVGASRAVAPPAGTGGRRTAAAPVADESPPAVVTRRRAGATAAHGRGAARRSGERKGGKDWRALGGVLALLGVLALGIGWWATRPTESTDAYSVGLEHMSAGRLAEAVASFESIPPTSSIHAEAQVALAEARETLAADEQRASTRKAATHVEVLKALEKWCVPREANYHGYVRYLLKRSDEFLRLYPADARVAEVKERMERFAGVASLAVPPTYQDVEAELFFRLQLLNPDFRSAMAAIDEFAALGAEQAGRAEALRDQVRRTVSEHWSAIHGGLQKDGSLTAGQENWNRVAQQARRHLDAVAGVAGLTEVPEARVLYERALKGG